MITIAQIANKAAQLTMEEKIRWEPNGPNNSFKVQLGDLKVTITKPDHALHPTFAVYNAEGQLANSYTASDFMGNLAHTLADLHRIARDQAVSGKDTMVEVMARLNALEQ